MTGSPLGRRRTTSLLALLTALVATLAVAAPTQAVNRDHGNRLVSSVPADVTPHVVDGAVLSFVQVGSRMVAAGSFTRVRQTPTGSDIVRNGIFAFDAVTGVIDPSFNPNLGGTARSLDTDGTHVYVGGSFGSVAGDASVRRLAKLTATGRLVRGMAQPGAGVNDVVVRGTRVFIGGQFTTVGGVSRRAFAVLDATTGAVLPVDVPFTGTYNGGGTAITRMDVNPAGTSVVAVGNFVTVAGQPREQIAIVSTPAGSAATLSSWSTPRFSKARNGSCAQVFQTWMRDVDISPDGRFFVVTTTGAFGGGANAGTLCDTTSRWELGRTGTGQEPTWITYTGGDTSYGVAVTGGAVYTGGHFRWQNNPFQGDQAGPGAVPREGIAALDPVNGLPLSWNPGRTRGVGAQALYATGQGLWVGSDTDRFAGRLRMRLAYLPLVGGTTMPTVRDAALPGAIFIAPKASSTSGGVIVRTNTGGPALQSGDTSANWSTDAGRATGGTTSVTLAIPRPDSTTPGTVPWQLFSSQRVGTHRYAFPVTAGRQVTVRLYFSSTSATARAGQQRVDVSLDGRLVLDDFDVVAATGGPLRGTTRQFALTSDGTVDVSLTAVLGSPGISGIEVTDRVAVAQPGPTALQRRSLAASGAPTTSATAVSTAMDFSRVRGATVVGKNLYYGLSDGGLYARSFDPASGAVGAQRTLRLYDDPEDLRRIPFPVANLTGLAFDADTRRLYYTLLGDPQLYYRQFSPESEVVGAQTFVAAGGGLSWATTAGMTVVDDRLLYGSSSDGRLRSVPLVGGRVTGAPTVLSTDTAWGPRDFFVAPPG